MVGFSTMDETEILSHMPEA
ncbi:uncharacterized protein FTOL_13920 [Fusarium torulosum]|uniref:Uncharacterized protein n=1 Tax=Fusarium torulosum TaxID=33205 RepID=A0AAE8SQF6_9HYPO|nr:uncharacterized protein FTOL_13920 [Fusarium torulosum]